MTTPSKFMQLRNEYLHALLIVSKAADNLLATLDGDATATQQAEGLHALRRAHREVKRLSEQIDSATRAEMLYTIGMPAYSLVPNAITDDIAAAYLNDGGKLDSPQTQHNAMLAAAKRYGLADIYGISDEPGIIAGYSQSYTISGHSGHGGTADWRPPGL